MKIRILWLVNIELSAIEAEFGRHTVIGGWLEQPARQLAMDDDIELGVVCPSEDDYFGVKKDNIQFYSFKMGEREEERFDYILRDFCPEIIHIWGTEYTHSQTMIELAEKKYLLESTVISIQGLIGVCAYHYCEGLPFWVIYHKTFKEWLGKKTDIVSGYKNMKRLGSIELLTIKKAKNIIGRTEWDLACIKQMNPDAKYYHCNETLRVEFYSQQWILERCNRHTVFFSQCHYPIKGFHQLLKALPLLIKKYPDIHVYVVGDNLYEKDSGIHRMKRTSYEWYLLKLIKQFKLENYVTFLGRLNAHQMIEQYCRANVFVCASNIENSSNSIGEAMMIGTPVVASDVGGVKSLITHEIEGLLYQQSAYYMLADCIDRILCNDELAERLSINARKRAFLIHDPENNRNTLLDIYAKLL